VPTVIVINVDDEITLTLLVKENWYSIDHVKEVYKTIEDFITNGGDTEQKIIRQNATLLPHERYVFDL